MRRYNLALLEKGSTFDERKHPRDDDGKFAAKQAEFRAATPRGRAKMRRGEALKGALRGGLEGALLAPTDKKTLGFALLNGALNVGLNKYAPGSNRSKFIEGAAEGALLGVMANTVDGALMGAMRGAQFGPRSNLNPTAAGKAKDYLRFSAVPRAVALAKIRTLPAKDQMPAFENWAKASGREIIGGFDKNGKLVYTNRGSGIGVAPTMAQRLFYDRGVTQYSHNHPMRGVQHLSGQDMAFSLATSKSIHSVSASGERASLRVDPLQKGLSFGEKFRERMVAAEIGQKNAQRIARTHPWGEENYVKATSDAYRRGGGAANITRKLGNERIAKYDWLATRGGRDARPNAAKQAAAARRVVGRIRESRVPNPFSLALLERGAFSERLHPRDDDGKFAPKNGLGTKRLASLEGRAIKTPKGAMNGIMGTAPGRGAERAREGMPKKSRISTSTKLAFGMGALAVPALSAAAHAKAHASHIPSTAIRTATLALKARRTGSKLGLLGAKHGARELARHSLITGALAAGAVAGGAGIVALNRRRKKLERLEPAAPSARSAILGGARRGAVAGAAAGLGGSMAMAPLNAAYLSYHEKYPNPGVTPLGMSKKKLALIAGLNTFVGPALHRDATTLLTAPVLMPAGALAGAALGGIQGYRRYKKDRRIRESNMTAKPYSLALLEGTFSERLHPRDKDGKFASKGGGGFGRGKSPASRRLGSLKRLGRAIHSNTFDHEVKSAAAARGALKKGARAAGRLARSSGGLAVAGLGSAVAAGALARRAVGKVRQGNEELRMYSGLRSAARGMEQMSKSSIYDAADRAMMAGSAERTGALAKELGGIVKGTYGRAALAGGGALAAGVGAGLAARALYKRRKSRGIKESMMRPYDLELLEFGLFSEKDHPRDKDGKFTGKGGGFGGGKKAGGAGAGMSKKKRALLAAGAVALGSRAAAQGVKGAKSAAQAGRALKYARRAGKEAGRLMKGAMDPRLQGDGVGAIGRFDNQITGEMVRRATRAKGERNLFAAIAAKGGAKAAGRLALAAGLGAGAVYLGRKAMKGGEKKRVRESRALRPYSLALLEG